MKLRRTADELIPELALYQRRYVIAGAVGVSLSFVGAVLRPTQFFQSYLSAYCLVLGATLGCLGFGMIHQLSGGAWGVVTRRLIGAASRLLPALTVLFVPVAVGVPWLYEWSHADRVAADALLRGKAAYLNTPFFLVRAAFYFAVWNALAHFLNTWSIEHDRTGDPELARRMQKLSGGGLVAYGLTVTFASFDWLMSLDPHWVSAIYGILVIGGQGVTALSVLIVSLSWLSRRPPLDQIVTHAHFHDLGNLLLAFVMLWAYFSFSQYLIIYSGNLPEEVTWYTRRLHTSWRIVGQVLIAVHFAVPFLLLLSRRIKRDRRVLAMLALGLVVIRALDLMWLVAPEFHRTGLSVSWLDLILPLALGTLWVGLFLRELRGRALLPVDDPQFGEAIGPLVRRAEAAPGRTSPGPG